MGNLAWIVRDLVALIELQGLMFLVDAANEFRKVRLGLLVILSLVALGAGSVPIGLAGASLILADATGLTIGQAFFCVAVCGLLLACGGIWLAIRSVKPGPDCLERSRAEWRCNVNWLNETLHNLGNDRTGANKP